MNCLQLGLQYCIPSLTGLIWVTRVVLGGIISPDAISCYYKSHEHPSGSSGPIFPEGPLRDVLKDRLQRARGPLKEVPWVAEALQGLSG